MPTATPTQHENPNRAQETLAKQGLAILLRAIPNTNITADDITLIPTSGFKSPPIVPFAHRVDGKIHTDEPSTPSGNVSIFIKGHPLDEETATLVEQALNEELKKRDPSTCSLDTKREHFNGKENTLSYNGSLKQLSGMRVGAAREILGSLTGQGLGAAI